jgi:NTE family protein
VNPGSRFTLVLGGGGMKGLAHIGVLQALLERGHRPAHIIGCSVGSLVGTAWAAGKSIPELRDIAITLKRKDVFQIAHADMAFKRMRSPALFRREPLELLIARLVGDVGFADLALPVIVNTVDINSGMQVLWGLPGLDDIQVRDAVFGSCALPGYLPPHEIRGRFYADGATMDNLPVVAARALDSELILAVDVSAAVFGRATEIAMQSLLELRLRYWTTPAVYYIHPRVEHVSLFSFDHLREVVEEGYRATIEALDRPATWPPRGAEGVYPKRRVLVHVERDRCIGAAPVSCRTARTVRVDNDRKAVVTEPEQEWSPTNGTFIRHCPVRDQRASLPSVETLRKSG